MKQTAKKFITVIILIYGLSSLQAQETIPATGGEATGTGSASYSVGQVFYNTLTGTNGNSIVQGVQLPYEISIVIGIPEAEGIKISISAYPNPTIDLLTIHVKNYALLSLKFQLFDLQGKLLKSKNIITDKTEINTSDLTAGTYLLNVTDNEKIIKTFKIIKN